MKTAAAQLSGLLIRVGRLALPGTLALPERARGVVLFALGSGSSRHSPRNRFVAGVLQTAGVATVLFDLLTEDEAASRELVFDIELLAQRLRAATRWAETNPATKRLNLGLFGASTGAAAALAVASMAPGVRAVVSRGGRPDLAEPWLSSVTAPTLLIVGGEDGDVLELNRGAFDRLSCVKQLEVIPGATHLFEEPGALEAAAQSAAAWFVRYLANGGAT